MKKRYIKFGGVENIFCFTEAARLVDGDVTVKRGKYIVDGKSRLGVIALFTPDEAVIVEYPEEARTFEKFLEKYINE